jgi:hypothetical protein
MNYREEIKQYVTEVWNYNQAVVDAFDDKDYEIIGNLTSFQLWNFKKSFSALLEVLFIEPVVSIISFLRGLLK